MRFRNYIFPFLPRNKIIRKAFNRPLKENYPLRKRKDLSLKEDISCTASVKSNLIDYVLVLSLLSFD